MMHLSHLAVTSPLSYLIALLLPALDVIIPVLPSETAIITLGVATAGSTDQDDDPRVGAARGSSSWSRWPPSARSSGTTGPT